MRKASTFGFSSRYRVRIALLSLKKSAGDSMALLKGAPGSSVVTPMRS